MRKKLRKKDYAMTWGHDSSGSWGWVFAGKIFECVNRDFLAIRGEQIIFLHFDQIRLAKETEIVLGLLEYGDSNMRLANECMAEIKGNVKKINQQ